jgi:hypothetical protein
MSLDNSADAQRDRNEYPAIGEPAGRLNALIEGGVIHGPGLSGGRAAWVTGALIAIGGTVYAEGGSGEGVPFRPGPAFAIP